MANWRVLVSEGVYVLVEDSKLVTYEDEDLMYFIKNPGTDAVETIATFKVSDIIGAYKEDAEISRASQYPRRGGNSSRIHVRKQKSDGDGVTTFPAVERT